MKKQLLHTITLSALLSIPAMSFGQSGIAPDLGPASGFVLFSPAGAISNTGLTVVTGDVGTISGAVTGISTSAPVPPAQTGVINGSLHEGDALTTRVDSFVQAAFTALAGNSIDSTLVYTAGIGNKQVLKPYVYYLGGATSLTDTLFLDAQGDANALFVFQINGVLNTSSLSRIVLMNGASVSNVYWQINGAANLGANSIFEGIMIANGAISLGNGSTLIGQGLSTFDAINIDSNTVNLPSNPTPLAISLLSFSAAKDGERVKLSWITASEQNSLSFIAERSSSAKENTWTPVGSLPASGSSSSKKQYSMTDYNAAKGTAYYRLRSINTNGGFTLSNVAVIYADAGAAPVSVFPNPATGSVTVSGAMPGSTIQLMDITGRILQTVSAGVTGFDKVATSSLSSGSYMLNVTSANGSASGIKLNKQ